MAFFITGVEIASIQCQTIKIKHEKRFKSKFKEKMFKSTIEKLKSQVTVKEKFYFNNFFRENEFKPWFFDINESCKFIITINLF